MRRVLTPSVYVVLIAAAIGLLVLNMLVWGGGIVSEPTPASEATPAAIQPPSPPAVAPEPQRQPVAQRRPQPQATAPATELTISATRGDCWVEVRAASATGDVLYEGVLSSGRTIRFRREKIWLRLGAASNVDVVVNGHPSDVPPGTVELVLPA